MKIKVFLFLFYKQTRHEALMENGCIAPHMNLKPK